MTNDQSVRTPYIPSGRRARLEKNDRSGNNVDRSTGALCVEIDRSIKVFFVEVEWSTGVQ
jgi:hypothetical protein